MSILVRMGKALRAGLSGKRTWTPEEVRILIREKDFDKANLAAEHLSENLAEPAAENACLLGEIAFHQRRDEDAERYFSDALKAAPGMAEAHHGLSLLMSERNDFSSAVRHSFFACSVKPNDARLLAQLGYCNLRLQNYSLAEAPLRRATLLAPQDSYAWNNLGIVLRLKGHLMDALNCFRIACDIDPENHQARENLIELQKEVGSIPGVGKLKDAAPEAPPSNNDFGEWHRQVVELETQGLLQAAIDLCESLAADSQHSVRAALELHRLYEKAGDPHSGIEVLETLLTKLPEEPAAVAKLGLAKLDMRDFKAAEALLKQAAVLNPSEANVALGLGRCVASQEKFSDAMEWFDKALELEPNDIHVLAHRAANVVNMCKYEEGLVLCQQLKDKGVEIPALGFVLGYLGRFDAALEVLDDYLQRHPNDPSVRFHRATIHLLHLDFEKGWQDYAYRGFSMSENFRVLPFPLWKGEPLKGRRIVVLAEQGLGDQIMFASCLPSLLKQGPELVVLEAIHRIAPTLARSFPECKVIATSQSRLLHWVKDCPDVDYYVPLGDLPSHFRKDVIDFPEESSFLRPDPTRVSYWRTQLEASGPGPYIGISWKGGTESTRTSLRSITLDPFQALSKTKQATWVCLQYGDVSEPLEVARANGFSLAYWPEAVSDLDEFAALVKALDLVITVCNTTVHYAGAVGTRTWVLSPMIPEWRYGLINEILPWYRSSRMYRQPAPGDWDAVFEKVGRDLSRSNNN